MEHSNITIIQNVRRKRKSNCHCWMTRWVIGIVTVTTTTMLHHSSLHLLSGSTSFMKQPQQQQQPSLQTLFTIKSTFVHAFAIQRIWNVPKRQCHHQPQPPPKKHRFRSSMDHDEISKTTTTTTTLSLHDASSIHQNNQNSNNNNSNIQFLGKGVDAIVRLGVVLVAPQNEFHHFYRQAAIYIYAMGYDNEIPNNDTASSSSTYYIRGVIVDHPTPFTVQEMIPSLAAITNPQQHQHPLASNLIFRGGDRGRENSVLLLHNQKNIPGCSDEIGTSGLYHGGFDYLVSSSSDSTNHHTNENDIIDMDGNNFKFFFNYCEFTEDELEELFASNEDGDAWASVQIHDPSILLNEEWDRGDCWRYIRNGIVSQMKVSE